MKHPAPLLLSLLALGLTLVIILAQRTTNPPPWSANEIQTLRSLWLGSLPALPPDPSNHHADDPQAAELGHRLFFDARFSANGQVSCATCHPPNSNFKDHLPRSQGIGLTRRRSMSVTGTAYSPWFFWDGRKDSQWAQALDPVEDAAEHGITRMQVARLIAENYRAEYETVFGALPDFSDLQRFPIAASPRGDSAAVQAWNSMSPGDRQTVNRVFTNFGKAIAAYERLLLPAPSRFDAYVAALLADDPAGMKAALSANEVHGLRLFITTGGCINCHNGPLFTNNDFHNTGVPQIDSQALDSGRMAAIALLKDDEFNCLGEYSDAAPEDCQELRFVLSSGRQIEGGFKPPSLRGAAEGAPYMHNGELKTLAEVLQHYNRAPASQFAEGYSELIPLRFSKKELAQLEAFIHSLSAPLNVDPHWLKPPE